MVCTAGAIAATSHNIRSNAKKTVYHKSIKRIDLTDNQKKRIEERMERIVEQDIRNSIITI